MAHRVDDRGNRRIQVFTLEGKYINQVFINRTGPSGQSVAGIAFSPDRAQRFMYVADFGSSQVVVVERKTYRTNETTGVLTTGLSISRS